MQMTKYIEMIKDISCDGNFAIKFQSKWNEMKWNGLLCDAQIDASNKNELGFKLERTLKASTQGPEKLVSACKHVIFLHRGTGGNWRWFQPLVLPLIYPQPPLRWPTMEQRPFLQLTCARRTLWDVKSCHLALALARCSGTVQSSQRIRCNATNRPVHTRSHLEKVFMCSYPFLGGLSC